MADCKEDFMSMEVGAKMHFDSFLSKGKGVTLSWLKDKGPLAPSRIRTICGSAMKLFESGDKSDGYVWECRKQVNGKRHRCERSIQEREVGLKKRT